MKEIALDKGKVALVDDADYEWLNQWKWYAHYQHGYWYAARAAEGDGNKRQRHVSMHRLILGAPKGVLVDHKDGNGLNNQRDNIRLCTNAQNVQNQKLQEWDGKSCSQYKGVSQRKGAQKWEAGIKISGKSIHLGAFDCDVDAALAYDAAAVEHFGEFARLNFPNGIDRPRVERKRRIRTSQFLGVGWIKADDMWQSRITVNKKEIWLGRFAPDPKPDAAIPYDAGEVAAALVRDAAALKYFGESAKLNFISV